MIFRRFSIVAAEAGSKSWLNFSGDFKIVFAVASVDMNSTAKTRSTFQKSALHMIQYSA